MQAIPPFPPSGSFLQSVRSSSRALRQSAAVQIHPPSITRLLTSHAFTDSFHRLSTSHGLTFPLKFPSHLSELNFISILSLLNFASGYRRSLHSETGRGAWDNIRAFVLSLYLSSSADGHENYMSASGMQTIGLAKVGELLRVKIHIEKPHETIPSVMVGSLGGPHYELVKLLMATLNETGQILVQSGYPDLGSFVVQALRDGAKGSDAYAVDVVVERVVRAFPAFRDMSYVDGQVVYCFKKALFLVFAIHARFSTMSPQPFPVPSQISFLPVFSDNVLPSMLIHLGVVDIRSTPLASTLKSMIPVDEALSSLLGPPPHEAPVEGDLCKEGPLLTSDQAFLLRASAIDTCELIVEAARNIPVSSDLEWIRHITLPELDLWLWGVAKDRHDYRSLERVVEKGTAFY